MSHGGVATRLKAGDIFYGHFTSYYQFSSEVTSEQKLKTVKFGEDTAK